MDVGRDINACEAIGIVILIKTGIDVVRDSHAYAVVVVVLGNAPSVVGLVPSVGPHTILIVEESIIPSVGSWQKVRQEIDAIGLLDKLHRYTFKAHTGPGVPGVCSGVEHAGAHVVEIELGVLGKFGSGGLTQLVDDSLYVRMRYGRMRYAPT